jgi:glycosyltransferase involved in cell wall biosynthesis
MKVCVVNSFYPPWVGGAETYVSSIARELARKGHEVTVYCSERPLKAGKSFEDGVRVVRMKTPLLLYGTPLVAFPSDFLKERYDVVHANFPSPYLAAASAFSAAFEDTPAVLTWHNDLPSVSSGAGVLVTLHDAVAPTYLNLFDRIIATTETYARKSRLLRRYSSRVRVIHNGVDTKKFNPQVSGDGVRERYGLQGKVALFVGALTTWHGYKGLDVLIRAFALASKRCDGLELLIVGEGQMKNAYQQLADQLGLAERVKFAGHVGDDMLANYYAACDFTVLPSKDSSEGFGIVLLEAMASGKPVVGSRVGGVVDVIKDGENGVLVEPNDVDGLADEIIQMWGGDERRIAMGSRGRAFAELHDWIAITRMIESTYVELQ